MEMRKTLIKSISKSKLKNFYSIFFTVLFVACSTEDVGFDQHASVSISFGKEVNVTINGIEFDAMEPFISPDGETLFFNSLNDGINTKIYYADRINDSVFNYLGELKGVNQAESPHLDAVPDMDMHNNFYWTSTRDYPARLDNLFYGVYKEDTVINIGRLQGDFYKDIPGWIVMDHGISLDGQLLYFNNARFDTQNCQGPCETELGIARKENDSTFVTIPESASILQNITDPQYIYYAPCISSDNLELYFTRYLKGFITPETQVEICVAVRTDSSVPFSPPVVLFSDDVANIVEAPTISADKKVLYYHRKTGNTHKIILRCRNKN